MNTNKIIAGKDSWKAIYNSKKDQCHKKTWLTCELSNGSDIFLLEDGNFKDIKDYCLKNNVFIKKAGLKYRSHQIFLDTDENAEAYYIVKSARGSMAGETKNCIVLGILVNGKIKKKAFMLPELIVAYEDEDDIETCFMEALIYNDKKKT